jgi:serine/threonine protein kinase
MSFDGRVILGDFGVALIQAYGDTEPGQVLGKLGCLAPEMVVMEEVDHRADLFAAGVVLWELLTGERLYSSASEEKVMADIADGKVPRPRKLNGSINKSLELVLLQALAKKPKDRFETAEAMLYALEPHWSQQVANPHAMSALLSSIYRQQSRQWREQRLSTKTTVDVAVQSSE